MYAPDHDVEEEAKDDFYDQLQKVTDRISKHDILIIMGGWRVARARRKRESNGERSPEMCQE